MAESVFKHRVASMDIYKPADSGHIYNRFVADSMIRKCRWFDKLEDDEDSKTDE